MTAAQAWPDRPTEPPLPEGPDLARACATLAACLYLDDLGHSGPLGRAKFASECANPPRSLDGALFNFRNREEEHGVPLESLNERLAWLLPVAVDAKGDCAKVRAARTPAPPGMNCSSDGCAQRCFDAPVVSCGGTVATIAIAAWTGWAGKTYVRDCSHALTTCDPTSPTGCKDRPFVACDPEGGDRCDGAIHLGCRANGHVSLRDCSRYGGICAQGARSTANCIYPYPACELPTCTGNTLNLCTLGMAEAIDCVALGFAGCDAGRCYH